MVFRLATLRKIEESPWTKNWDHITAVDYGWLKRQIRRHPDIPTPARTRDRIKQWNIVPGDRVRVRGDGRGGIREVFGINKYANLVYLKSRQQDEEKSRDGRPSPPSVPYSQCQLYIGDREFPPLPGETQPRIAPVFASRIGYSSPKYDVKLSRFVWERFAAQTTPRLGIQDEKVKITIPWPNPPEPSIPPIGANDTPADVAKEITWSPSASFYPPSNHGKAKILQDAYLQSIRPTETRLPVVKYDQESLTAIEFVLGDELSNPHSRIKKRRRAREYIKARRLAHERFVESELANLDGRTRKEARVEAEWKWTELRKKEEHARRRKQWILRGGARRVRRKRLRKARKERQVLRKMRNLVLDPAPNQVLPGSQPTTV